MEDQPIIIHVAGDVEAEILQQGVARFKESYGGAVDFTLDLREAIAVENVFTVETALSIATLLSVLFHLVVDVVERTNRVDWNRLSFLKAIEAEMKQQGVTDYFIEDIINFGCLLGKGDCPCEVTILSRKSTRGYRSLLFRDGKAFTFQIGHHVSL
jgi:hypothetical protein